MNFWEQLEMLFEEGERDWCSNAWMKYDEREKERRGLGFEDKTKRPGALVGKGEEADTARLIQHQENEMRIKEEFGPLKENDFAIALEFGRRKNPFVATELKFEN